MIGCSKSVAKASTRSIVVFWNITNLQNLPKSKSTWSVQCQKSQLEFLPSIPKIEKHWKTPTFLQNLLHNKSTLKTNLNRTAQAAIIRKLAIFERHFRSEPYRSRSMETHSSWISYHWPTPVWYCLQWRRTVSKDVVRGQSKPYYCWEGIVHSTTVVVLSTTTR